MKTLLALTLIAIHFLGLNAYAQTFDFPINLGDSTTTVIAEKTVSLPTEISEGKIKLTALGYQTKLIKVINPELAAHTLLNHRNEGEDGPCLFTLEAWNNNEVVQDNPLVEDIDFTITQSRRLVKDETNNVCKVFLVEDITAEIRGFHFQHHLTSELPDRVLADCI